MYARFKRVRAKQKREQGKFVKDITVVGPYRFAISAE